MKCWHLNKGFTLLELSIVLVIIGLIIGGIVAGSGLIESAKMNSVHSDITKYKIAIATFKLKYNANPGDFQKATSYWPTECVDSGSNPCNGNGDSYVAGDFTRFEGFRIWQHLSLAQLLPNQYSGLGSFNGTSYPEYQIGVNVPKSSIEGGGFILHSTNGYSSTWDAYNGYLNGHLILVGSTIQRAFCVLSRHLILIRKLMMESQVKVWC